MLKGWRSEKDKTCLPWTRVCWLHCYFRGWWYRPIMGPKALGWTEAQGQECSLQRHWTQAKDTQQVTLILGGRIRPMLMWRSTLYVLSTRQHQEPPPSFLYKREIDTYHLSFTAEDFLNIHCLPPGFTSNCASMCLHQNYWREKITLSPGNFLLPF